MYTQDLADELKTLAGEKWRPCNGTEGELFIDSWCGRCVRDVNHDCPILAATMAFDVSDERYPAEWQYSESGQPKCVAFEKRQ